MSLVTNTDDLAKASPKTKRTVRYQHELCHAALDCVFQANNTREFRMLVEASVVHDKRFEMLPAYRQVALDAYIQGALDAMAKLNGLPLSEPPDAVRPKPRVSSVPPRPSRRPHHSGLGELGTSHSDIWRASSLAAAARKM